MSFGRDIPCGVRERDLILVDTNNSFFAPVVARTHWVSAVLPVSLHPALWA
ncbi:MAG: hypothetical protein IJB57_00655 [Clostridia bacterium]|nr:hypothetical protein [Clostridia bacterium]